MKKIYITIVLILASLLIAPKFIGAMVETERQRVLVKLNETDGITLTTSQYSGGWFGADVVSEMKIALEDNNLNEVTITVEEDISFGPVIITDKNWYFGLGYSTAKFKFAALGVDERIVDIINEKLHVGALLGFSKDVTTFINTDKISYQDTDSVIVSEPSFAQFTLINNEHIIGDFSWGGLDVKGQDERLVIGDVGMSTKQKVVSGDYLAGTAILTGDAIFTVTGISVYNDNSKVFSLDGATLTSEVSLDNDLLALALNYQAKEISASGQYFKEPNVAVLLANIDVHALQELNTAMANLSVNASGEYDTEESLKVLSAVAEKILAKDPNLKITDLSVVTEEGKVATEFNFNINKDLFDSANLNSMALIKALEADAKGKAPMAFLSKLGMAPMVDNFVEQGYLNRHNNEITVEAKYVQSQLTVNGKAFQL
ncbi:YdgA family protein [Colwellia psychrerythraea]|uniref:DUF945 domain-containing protein n=1 Tax=Colwellia psychrerythraea (strain 34H / ATCC BAA-681) TaxID=167879 RepID=Q47VB0_COLP3|nr:DUF945 family protein [Colwellia psychrerythraea]AAZ27771.1 hypothetical protein CPS_4615 [Colwellia psychrerythraea 34H]